MLSFIWILPMFFHETNMSPNGELNGMLNEISIGQQERTFTHGRIDYWINRDLNEFHKNLVQTAIDYTNRNTFFTLQPMLYADRSDRFLEITFGDVCHSGMWENRLLHGDRSVRVYVHIGCAMIMEDVLRELFHALGYNYQHLHFDRDFFVDVFPNRSTNPEYFFRNVSAGYSTKQYDITSLMHYDPYYAAHQANNGDPRTMVPRNVLNLRHKYAIGSSRIQLTDLLFVRSFYNPRESCIRSTCKCPELECKNGGRSSCEKCICPLMFTGDFCDIRSPGRQPFNGRSCGETLMATNVLQTHAFYHVTPLFTDSGERNSECYYVIEKTDPKKSIRLTLYDYQTKPKIPYPYCRSGVQIYIDGEFSQFPITFCGYNQVIEIGAKDLVSSSKIVIRMYWADRPNPQNAQAFLAASFIQQ